MALSEECKEFVERWKGKADATPLDKLEGYFDKFLTLYTIYNRLYSEVAFVLNSAGHIHLNANLHIPDAKAATDFVAQFLKLAGLQQLLDTKAVTEALADMGRIIENEEFNIILVGPKSIRDRKSDLALLKNLRSGNVVTQGKAVLQFVYAVRCNTVHGSKAFLPVLANVLGPCIRVLETLIPQLVHQLDQP